MKKAKSTRAEETFRLVQQAVGRAGAMRIALAATIAEAGMPVDPILSRMDRMLAALEKPHPGLYGMYAPHVAELKLMIKNPVE